jgi:hypothetical protein
MLTHYSNKNLRLNHHNNQANNMIIWFYVKNKTKEIEIKTFKSMFLSHKKLRLKINRHTRTHKKH